jgi:glutathione S-transferase
MQRRLWRRRAGVFGATGIKAVTEHLDKAKAAMPFLLALSSEERSETLRAGDKLIEGAVQIIELVREYGDYIPKAVADPDEMDRDAGLDAGLAQIEAQLAELLKLVQDARLLARSDLARAALAAYTASRMIPDDLGAASNGDCQDCCRVA